ncbi:MAG: PhoH family protein [Thermoanaerobaculaceae bacterium]
MKPVDIYVPDTSALVENPDCLERLLAPGNLVILLQQVLRELAHLQGSRHKSEGVRAAARAVVRKILALRNTAVIHKDPTPILTGALPFASLPTTPTGGVLAWEPPPVTVSHNGNGDAVIVAAVERIARLTQENGSFRVVLISEDSNMLLTCDARNIPAEPLRFGKVALESPDDLFRGVVEGKGSPHLWDAFLASGPPKERFLPLEELPFVTEPLPNLGVILHLPQGTLVLRVDSEKGQAQELRFAHYWDARRGELMPRTVLGFTPADPYQLLALEFLLDPTVQLVILDGPAGSGKTRLMVVAALYLLFGQPAHIRVKSPQILPSPLYSNGLVLLRPEHSASHFEMGYLPGDHNSKLSPWLEPFLQAIRSVSVANGRDFYQDLESSRRLTLLSTSFLRGLDIEESLVLVDELQNGDRHLAKTLMSRFSASTKAVLAGCLDPIQIDNPYVDWRSNALTRIKESYKGFGPYVAQVRLVHNYRGPISTRADAL